MLFCINVEFRELKLQIYFSQDALFIGCDIFRQVISLHLFKHVFLYKYISIIFTSTNNKTNNKYEK